MENKFKSVFKVFIVLACVSASVIICQESNNRINLFYSQICGTKAFRYKKFD